MTEGEGFEALQVRALPPASHRLGYAPASASAQMRCSGMEGPQTAMGAAMCG